MTKQEVLALIEKFPDGTEFTFPSFWVRDDVRNLDNEPLTDRQWEYFCYWYEKYPDASFDFDAAIRFAMEDN